MSEMDRFEIEEGILDKVKGIAKSFFGKGDSDKEDVYREDINWSMMDALSEGLSDVKKVKDLKMLRGRKKNLPGFVPFKKKAYPPGKTPVYITGEIEIMMAFKDMFDSLRRRADTGIVDELEGLAQTKEVQQNLFDEVTDKKNYKLIQTLLRQAYYKESLKYRLMPQAKKFAADEMEEDTDDFKVMLSQSSLEKQDSRLISGRGIKLTIRLLWVVYYPKFPRP